MSLNLATILRESAELHPDKSAIVLGETHVDYKTLWTQTQAFAGALQKLGLLRGQRVALLLPNVPQFTMAYFGTHLAGGAVVPLNVLLTGEEIAYHLEDSKASIMVTWEGFFEHAESAFKQVKSCTHLVIAKTADLTAPQGMHNMAACMAEADPVTDLPDTMPDDTAVILYTSGTTGRAKGAELTHFNMYYNAEYVQDKLLPLTPQTVALTTLPLFHSFGQTVMHNGVFFTGGTVVMLPKFDPTSALQLMHHHKVSLFAGVPAMYIALLNHPEASSYDLSALEYCVSGGSAMPVHVMTDFDKKYNVNILEGYGLSETSPVASFNVLDRPKKAGSIGLPLRGIQFRLVDDAGQIVLKTDEPGEICIKGHNIMKGYLDRPEANAEAIKDGWFYTGDIATRDADGYYFIVDRKKDMIIRGGYNVYPREIEEVLYKHEAIMEAAVIGIAHDKMGEDVKAVIALKPGMRTTPEEVITYCKEHLAAYKYPRVVEIIDSLPKGPTGKILKRVLKNA